MQNNQVTTAQHQRQPIPDVGCSSSGYDAFTDTAVTQALLTSLCDVRTAACDVITMSASRQESLKRGRPGNQAVMGNKMNDPFSPETVYNEERELERRIFGLYLAAWY